MILKIFVYASIYLSILVTSENPPLSFQSTNTDRIILKGNNEPLRCSAQSDPLPLYTWKLNDSSDIVTSTQLTTFILRNVQRNSVGQYRCLAINSVGGIRNKRFSLKIGYLERTAQSDSISVRVDSGGFAQFQYPSYEAYPKLTDDTVWLRGSVIVKNELRFCITLDKELVLLDVQSSDNGITLSSTLKNGYELEQITINYVLNVVNADNSPSIIKPNVVIAPQNVSVILGLSSQPNAQFQCIFNARPLNQLIINWYFTDPQSNTRTQLLTSISGSQYSNSGDPYNRTLLISSVSREDMGLYECEASLSNVADSRIVQSAWLQLLEAPELDKKESESDIEIDQGSDKTLVCSSKSVNPIPIIRWYKNTQLLNSNENFKHDLVSSGDLRMDLQFKSVTESDSGVYQCFVENSVGEDFYSVWLKISTYAPIIETKPQNASHIVGQEVTLQCRARGAPKPTISWTRNDVDIPTSDNIKVLSNGDLQIKTTESSHEGTYTCTATNSFGTVSASAQLYLFTRTQITQPPPAKTFGPLSTQITLPCGYKSDPRVTAVVTWYRLPQNIQVTDLTIQSDGGLRFNRGLLISDKGMYECRVQSTAGDDKATTELVVVEPPSPPVGVTVTLYPPESESTKSVTVTWRAGYDGNSAIIHFKVFQAESRGNLPLVWKMVTQVDESIREYRIETGLTPAVAYAFSVTASNSYGESEKSEATSALTMPQMPPSGPPLSVTARSLSNSSLFVQWEPPESSKWNGELTGYQVRYRIAGLNDDLSSLQPVVGSSVSNTVIKGLQFYRRFSVSVAARNSKGVGVYSAAVFASTAEARPTASPRELNATVLSSTSVWLEFLTLSPDYVNGNNLGYKIYFDCESSPLCSNVPRTTSPGDSTKSTILSLQIKDLQKYQQYNISVTCYTQAGEGPRSHPVSVTTLQDVPGRVDDLRFMNNIGESVELMWSPPPQQNGILTGYRLKYAQYNSSNPDAEKTIILAANQLNYSLTGLLLETKYEVKLSAGTSVGWGEEIKELFLSGVKPEKPSPPVNIIFSQIKSRSVKLEFIPGDPGKTSISLWIVEARSLYTNSDPRLNPPSSDTLLWSQIFSRREADARFLLLDNIRPYRWYQMRIVAQNIVGRSPPSSPTSWFRTAMEAPSSPPEDLQLRLVEDPENLLAVWKPLEVDQWNGPSQGYILSYSPQASIPGPVSLNISDPQTTSFTVSDLTPFTLYDFSVVAQNEAGKSGSSLPISILTWYSQPSSAPPDITLQGATSSSCHLIWSAIPKQSQNGPISGYIVFYKHSTDWQSYKIDGNQTLQSNISKLESSTAYFIQIAAFNAMGVGPKGPETPIRCETSDATDAPSNPKSLRCSSITATSCLLKWEASGTSKINGFRLRHQRGLQLANQTVVRVANEMTEFDNIGDVKEFSINGLQTNSFYFIELQARNTFGLSQPSIILVNLNRNPITRYSCSPPNIVSSSSFTLSLSWSCLTNDERPARIRHFLLQMKESSTANWNDVPQIAEPGMENMFHVIHLTPNTEYEFRVSAQTDLGQGSWSKASTTQKTLPATPADAPTNVMIKSVNTTAINISWTPIHENSWRSDRINYRIVCYRRGGSLSEWNIKVVDLSVSFYELVDLPSFIYLECFMLAENEAGQGPSTPPHFIYVGEMPPDLAPGEFSCDLAAANQVICWWNRSHSNEQADAIILQGYRIFYQTVEMTESNNSQSKSVASSFRNLLTVPQTSSQALITSFDWFTRYILYVVSYNPAGMSPASNWVTVSTNEGLPTEPTNLTVKQITTQSMLLVWSPPLRSNGRITNYRLEYSYTIELEKTTETRNFRADISSTENQYKDNSLRPDILYKVSLKASTSAGWGPNAGIDIPTYPKSGSPDPPVIKNAQLRSSSVTLTWSFKSNGGRIRRASVDPIIAVFIESQMRGDNSWQLVIYLEEATESYSIPLPSLQANTDYRFRVSAVNAVWMGAPSDITGWISIPDYKQGPFYMQWWFLVILAMIILIVVIITIAILAVTGRKNPKKEKYPPINEYANSAIAGSVADSFHDMDITHDDRRHHPSVASTYASSTFTSDYQTWNSRKKQLRPYFQSIDEDNDSKLPYFSSRASSMKKCDSDSYIDDDEEFDDSDDMSEKPDGKTPPPFPVNSHLPHFTTPSGSQYAIPNKQNRTADHPLPSQPTSSQPLHSIEPRMKPSTNNRHPLIIANHLMQDDSNLFHNSPEPFNPRVLHLPGPPDPYIESSATLQSRRAGNRAPIQNLDLDSFV